MTLTLCSAGQTKHIEITPDEFRRLRSPGITADDILSIAERCGVAYTLLAEYVRDLNRSLQEQYEIDSACDYTDQL